MRSIGTPLISRAARNCTAKEHPPTAHHVLENGSVATSRAMLHPVSMAELPYLPIQGAESMHELALVWMQLIQQAVCAALHLD